MLISPISQDMCNIKYKMQTGENCIGETANHLFDLFGVSNCNEIKGSEFEDWLKKQHLKEVVTREYKWRDFVLDEEFVLAKYNEDKQS